MPSTPANTCSFSSYCFFFFCCSDAGLLFFSQFFQLFKCICSWSSCIWVVSLFPFRLLLLRPSNFGLTARCIRRSALSSAGLLGWGRSSSQLCIKWRGWFQLFIVCHPWLNTLAGAQNAECTDKWQPARLQLLNKLMCFKGYLLQTKRNTVHVFQSLSLSAIFMKAKLCQQKSAGTWERNPEALLCQLKSFDRATKCCKSAVRL